MKSFFLLTASLLLLSLNTSAETFSFQGKWLGAGKAKTVNGKARQCTEIYIEWQENADTLVLRQGGYRCEDMDASFDSTIFVKKGEELLIENQKVGTISSERIFLSQDIAEEDLHYELTLTKSGDSLRYEEHWLEADKPVFDVQGNLLRAN